MFFEIENTPEHIRRARRKEVTRNESPKEECPRLILAPFTRPPQVIFENVLIGHSCVRNLEILNPSKQVQQITLGRALPPELVIHLPGEWMMLEPGACYCVTLKWTPTQPIALRETIRFTDENRGRYDVIVVLKSSMNIKGKSYPAKTFKISPGKIKKKVSKKSPVAIYKKKAEILYNTKNMKKTVSIAQSTNYKVYKSSNKENISAFSDFSIESHQNKCPFDSPTSLDFNFDTSEIFSNYRRTNTENILHDTYDKSTYSNKQVTVPISQSVLKPLNRQLYENTASDIFDQLTFTPLKSMKTEKLDKGPKIILSMNSDSELDDSLNVNTTNNENETHSVIYITSSQPPNKWLKVNHQHHTPLDGQYIEAPSIQNKKIPNTSSPKEMNSPNFSINTDFSRISELSFFPQRFSTERKVLPKINNETHELLEDPSKVSSDTYTKDSPNTPIDHHLNQVYAETKPPHYFIRDNPKMCRQSLFREYQQQGEAYDKNYLNPYESHNVWQSDSKIDIKSPPRFQSPPLQSIPEESAQLSDTQVLDKTDKQMSTFTINRTFDKVPDRNSISTSMRQSWSKKAIRAEPELWKIPIPLPRKSLKSRASINKEESLCGKMSTQRTHMSTLEDNKTSNQNVSLNQVGNVYSQSFTVDPFLSTTYFYDEEAVNKFEKEFKKWLNCILTPPADLDSNVEQKIDFGKAWIENRNKEVPAAPTKEQVCSVYHNNHRLESLRRAARILIMSPEISQVFQKLNAQIEKKLIAIRTDRNLHLDVGLQKIIMELLLSYNPLWLRIGLEAIYGLVLPLKSNSDIEGLTTFIIQRMFKNPYLKNKHSKSNVPNMLLPAYMEAIKKFTLKKFFMLVFFLDQAKQMKLISHDPCLFCRNAVCKESRDVIIKFTREVIAGIGDITKHLRPLGYVVSHKQSYLDEYKYAVHNIALDIRDGVRLTKVMEIILMKNDLLNQLRTPPISRLQKIHNVQVALNALKGANFVIVGDITANDIADGHREKTLSLLWQLIHEFRAPLFEKAANVIQTWWRKKYEVIVEKRIEEEKVRQNQINAASVIQCWWRRIQYNRLVEWQMYIIINLQAALRGYLLRQQVQHKREEKRREWAALKIQTILRGYLARKQARHKRVEQRREQAASIIQAALRWYWARRQARYKREEHRRNWAASKIQATWRGYLARRQVRYQREEQRREWAASKIQVALRWYWARRQARYKREEQRRNWAASKIQATWRGYLARRQVRYQKEEQRREWAASKIQATLRGYWARRQARHMRQEQRRERAAAKIQAVWRGYLARRQVRHQKEEQQRERAASKIQAALRRYLARKEARYMREKLRRDWAVLKIQATWRGYLARRRVQHKREEQRREWAASKIQTALKRYWTRRQAQYKREEQRRVWAASIIQAVWRGYLARRQARHKKEEQRKRAASKILAAWRGYLARRQVRRYKREEQRREWAASQIQATWRGYLTRRQIRAMREEQRREWAAFKIWAAWRGYLARRQAWYKREQQREWAASTIQAAWKGYLARRLVRYQREEQRREWAASKIQAAWGEYLARRKARYKREEQRRELAASKIQVALRGYLARKRARHMRLEQRRERAASKIQATWRGHLIRRQVRYKKEEQRRDLAALHIQAAWRGYLARREMRYKREEQRREWAVSIIRVTWRGYLARRQARHKIEEQRREWAALHIQTAWRGYLARRQAQYKRENIMRKREHQRREEAASKIQAALRGFLTRRQTQHKREIMIKKREEQRREWAASKIQALFRGHKARVSVSADKRVAELRRRWRDGALHSTQESLKERNEEAMEVLRNMSDIETVIRAFRSLELLTEVFPMMYNSNASSIVRRVYIYMSVTNRSISSIEVLKSAASVLVNLTRYRVTGPKLYARDRIPPILKFMWRFSNSEIHLFCILTTYLWLFSKYEFVREDLAEFLHIPENHKILVTIKGNIERMKRMLSNSRNKFFTPQPPKFVSHTGNQSLRDISHNTSSINKNSGNLLPALEPDYGIMKADKPRYFEDAYQAITCLFQTYNL